MPVDGGEGCARLLDTIDAFVCGAVGGFMAEKARGGLKVVLALAFWV